MMNQTVPKDPIIQGSPVRRHSSDFSPLSLSLLLRRRRIRIQIVTVCIVVVVVLPPEFVAIANWVHHVLRELDPLLLFLSLLPICENKKDSKNHTHI